MGNNDYINEQAALESGKFEYDIGVDGFGWKWAVRINEYVFSFGARDAHFEKNIRDIHAVFTVGLSEIIRSKLLIIKEKYTDARAGLYNSKYVQEVGAKKPYSIVRIDINDFKAVNDTYGHAAGDKVLENLWKVLKASVRTDDKACRDGWDEFILLIDSSQMVAVERIITRINNLIEILNEKSPFPIGVSIWYCLYDGNKSFQERAEIADTQMYSKKDERGNISRLAKKISLIQNPDDLQALLGQIQNNLKQTTDIA